MVIAGAGSGKTRVLTYRIANLISKGMIPSIYLHLHLLIKAKNERKDKPTHR